MHYAHYAHYAHFKYLASDRHMLIVIAATKGGVGKSAITLNLAVSLKANCIVDTDSSTKFTTLIINARNENQRKTRYIECITMPKPELVNAICDNHDDKIIVVDTGGQDTETNRVFIKRADIVIIPVTHQRASKVVLTLFAQTLKALNVDPERTYALLNMQHPSKRIFKEDNAFISSLGGLRVFKTKITRRDVIDIAMLNSEAASEYDPDCHSAMEFKALTKELKSVLKKMRVSA